MSQFMSLNFDIGGDWEDDIGQKNKKKVPDHLNTHVLPNVSHYHLNFP